MSKAYLFVEHLNDQASLSVSFDRDGNLNAPLLRRDALSYASIVGDGESILVLPATWVSLYVLTLPKLSQAKAHQAILFSLEEKLATSIDDVHIAFESRGTKPHQYEVVVIQKSKIDEVLTWARASSIPVDAITIDIFALAQDEVIQIPRGVLYRTEQSQGELSQQWVMGQVDLPKPSLQFKTAQKAVLWAAERLQKSPGLNLCWGDYQIKTSSQKLLGAYYAAGGLLVLSFFLFVLSHIVTLWHLHKDIKIEDAKINEIYYQFFPAAKQVINPRFRIGQLIESNNQGGNMVWRLMAKLDTVFDPKIYVLKTLTWRPDILTIALMSPDFVALEKLEGMLKSQGLKVNQTQSANQNGHVFATLELSL